MTEYLNKTFTVAMPTGKNYRDNWDSIFGKKPEPVEEPAACQCHGLWPCLDYDDGPTRSETEPPQ